VIIADELLTTLQARKQATQFSSPNDWVFASPVQLGRLPWSYDQVWRVYRKAAKAAGIAGLGTHVLRHYAEFGITATRFARGSARWARR
jgi:integrase